MISWRVSAFVPEGRSSEPDCRSQPRLCRCDVDPLSPIRSYASLLWMLRVSFPCVWNDCGLGRLTTDRIRRHPLDGTGGYFGVTSRYFSSRLPSSALQAIDGVICQIWAPNFGRAEFPLSPRKLLLTLEGMTGSALPCPCGDPAFLASHSASTPFHALTALGGLLLSWGTLVERWTTTTRVPPARLTSSPLW